jgi:hypothetical protein
VVVISAVYHLLLVFPSGHFGFAHPCLRGVAIRLAARIKV